MRIGVDFDDVLYPYHHYFKRRIHDRFGIDLRERQVTTFYYDTLPEFVARGIDRDAVWAEVQATWREVEDHAEAPLLDPEAGRVLDALALRHEVNLVTARSADSLPLVESFLERHRIRFDGILMGRVEKTGFEVLVDDFPKHALENARAGGYSLLYHADENSTFDTDAHPRIERVRSWQDVRAFVEAMEQGAPTRA